MSHQSFQVKLPMRMQTNRGGERESLNLNVYRNLHFRKLSYQKNAFHEDISPLLRGLPQLGKVTLHYEVNPKSGGRLDTMNVGSIVDKYFSDTLVEAGIIEDDDFSHVVFNSFSYGAVNPKDPHVLVTITEIEPRSNQSMRVLLDQTEIQRALEAFVQTMGLTGVQGVELTATADGSITAEIVMGLQQPKVATHTAYRETDSSGIVIRPKRGGRPLGSKNKPKEPDDVETSGTIGSDSYGSGTSEPNQKADRYTDSDDSPEEEDDRAESEESNGTPTPNLFGDSDDQSVNNDTDTDSVEEDEEIDIPVPEEQRVKKSSIFDE